jgi:hypothetical protein
MLPSRIELKAKVSSAELNLEKKDFNLHRDR